MSLPKIPKRLVSIFLLFFFLILASPVPILAAAVDSAPTTTIPAQTPSSTSTPDGYIVIPKDAQNPSSGYTIVPIPNGNSSQGVTQIPNPNSSNYSVQEAFSLRDIGDFFGGIAGKFGDFFGCIKDLGNCLQATAGNMIEFGVYIVEHTFLKQLAGDSAECILDPNLETNNKADYDRLQCAALQASPTAYIKEAPPYSMGLLGAAGNTTETLLAMPIPVSSSQYFASINPFKSASAAGQDDLQHGIILEIWKKVRDASLALSVVVLIILGFLIMFRFPLGPRNVVTVQNALPRIAIALILIVFSFAIAGLMVDLVKIANNLIFSFLPGVGWANAGWGILGLILTILIGVGSLAGLGALVGGPAGAVVGAIIGLLLLLIFAIILFIIFAIIIFKLTTRFVTFLLLVCFSPAIFLVGAVPNWEPFIFGWFKRATAALISIPATAFVIELAVRIGTSGPNQINATLPTTIFPNVLGAVGGAASAMFGWAFLAPIVGLVLFSMATKVPNIVDELFGVKPLAPRSMSGLGVAGAVVGAPIAAVGAAGSVGRSLGGIRTGYQAGGSAASWGRQRGWGGRGPSTPLPPAMGEMGYQGYVETPAAEQRPGFISRIARVVGRGPTTAAEAGEPRPYNTIIEPEREAQERAARPPNRPGTPTRPGKSDHTL
jgi:hypothetical protein